MENTGCGTDAAREIQIWEDREFLGYSVAVVGEWEARLLRRVFSYVCYSLASGGLGCFGRARCGRACKKKEERTKERPYIFSL
jgi:hypothetical protein